MFKRILILLSILISFSSYPSSALAARGALDSCGPSWPSNPSEPCIAGYCCKVEQQNAAPNMAKTYSCQKDAVCAAFGKVTPPSPVAQFLQNEPTGAAAISQFLSNFITLLFSIGAIVLIFMIVWGAFDWMTSGGEKEKLASAQKRIINAIIGIILFAVAFAALAILGRFTGFTLFRGQNYTQVWKNDDGTINAVRCRDGKVYNVTKNTNPDEFCQNK